MHYSITEFDHKLGFYDIELLNIIWHYEPEQKGDLNTPYISEQFEFNCNAMILQYPDDEGKLKELKNGSYKHDIVKELVLESYKSELIELVKS